MLNAKASRVVTLLVAVGIMSALVAGCRNSTPDLPEPSGAEVRDYLSEVNYTLTWELWPGKGRYYEGGEPHGARFTTYLNEPALEALNGHAGEMPNGAIIVKQNFTPEIVFDLITVMYKVDGYNPENNDWFWAKIGANGDVQAEGQVVGCQACHGGAKENDFVFTSSLK